MPQTGIWKRGLNLGPDAGHDDDQAQGDREALGGCGGGDADPDAREHADGVFLQPLVGFRRRRDRRLCSPISPRKGIEGTVLAIVSSFIPGVDPR